MTSSGEALPQTYYDTVEPYLRHGNKPGDRQYLADILQSWSPEIDTNNDIGWALHYAIFQGNHAAVQMIIDAGASPSLRDRQDPGLTPLLAASQYGRLQMAQLFWERIGPEGRLMPSKRRKSSPTCLQIAARNNHADITAYFLGVWDGWGDEDKYLALQDAASAWCDDTAAVLLADLEGQYGPDTIQDALEKAVGSRMILPEHETKPDPNATDMARQQKLVIRLIDAGADPDSNSARLNQPLLIHRASASPDRIGALKGLLDKGANPNRVDSQGKTALHHVFHSFKRGNAEDVALKTLLQHGALVEVVDENGETPLHVVAQVASCEQLKLCLSHCDASEAEGTRLQNIHGETLLHYAAVGGQRDTVEFLLDFGLDVNVSNTNGWTPLLCSLALVVGKKTSEMCETASFLLQHGAAPTVVTDEGWTPLHALASWPVAHDSTVRSDVAILAERLISGGAPMGLKSKVIRSPSTTWKMLSDVWGFRLGDFVKNAAVNVRDLGQADSTTPLMWARRSKATDVVDVIAAHVARQLDCHLLA
ncbi:ankyrin repeat-containing domain protein [Colletotrichum phormii]|uniref:Ankyrin repeat-containing domain protein n=1 Tax=Colletotrichum phormii TaxID=359342 RepID=A0AAI9ZE71_9PEZI|nr:ankyrin repeat-containing domain protein [Colletotrichum phormii]KAK1622588.1 ankyrin repeat-containing domain protein [Colletotrichum phormii]